MTAKPTAREDLEKRINELEQENAVLREAQAAHRVTELWLKNIFNSLEEAVLVVTPDRNLSNMNDAAIRMFGYSQKELADLSTEILHVDRGHYEEFGKIINAAFDRDEPAHFEFEARRKNGEIFPTEHTVTLLKGDHGEAIGIVSVVRDVTEQRQYKGRLEAAVDERTAELKRANEALRLSEERFRSLYENCPFGFIICELIRDHRGDYIDFIHLEGNVATETQTGFKLGQLIDKRASEIVTPEETRELVERYGRAVSTRSSIGYTQHFPVYDRTLEVTVFPLYDDLFILNFIDVSKRKEAEEALRESQRRLATLMSNLPGMAYRCRNIPDWPMEFVSEGSRAVTGYAPGELTEAGDVLYGDLIHPEDRGWVWQTVQESVEKGKPFIIEYRLLDKEGRERWVWEQGESVREERDGTVILEGFITDFTTKKLAMAEVESTSAFLDAVVDMSPFAMWVADKGGTVIRTNRSLREALNLTDEQIVGRYNVLEDKNLAYQNVMPMVKAVFSDRSPARFTIPWRAADAGEVDFRGGRDLYIDVSMFPIVNMYGELTSVVCQWVDITDRKEAEEALRESVAFIDKIVNTAPNLVYVYDLLENRNVYSNAGMERIFGFGAEDVHQMGDQVLRQLIHPEDMDRVIAHHEQLKTSKAEDVIEIDYRMKNRNGDYRNVRSWDTVFKRGEDGATQQIIGLAVDVTEQVDAEKELKRLQLYFENIFDSMPSVLVGVDQEDRVTQWNRTAQRMTGLTEKEARGQLLDQVMPSLSSHIQTIRDAIATRTPQLGQKIAERVNDETRYADIMVYPLIANGVEGAVIRRDDVTERVRIEQMMIQTEKMMSVGGLAAGMAHEINNPLGAIMQGVQNAIRRVSPDLEANEKTARACGTDLTAIRAYLEKRSILKYLEGMREASGRAAKIVSNMLTFSRRSESKLAPIEINDLIDSVLELADSDYDLQKKYDFRHVEIVRDYEDGLSQVPCTATEIEQVFLNIIRNAAEAMAEHRVEKGEPRITIKTRKEKDRALIEIEDNGPGMDEETGKRVFEPFFTTKPVGVGTGLGLSVSYFIVTNNHNGTLNVESETGKGTRFMIRLPLERK